jgi:hypothetical protein
MTRKEKKNVVIGYIGRCMPDKNIFQVFDIFFKLKENDPDDVYQLYIAGPTGSLSLKQKPFTLKWVNDELKRRKIPPSSFKYFGRLSYDKIWDFYRNIDIMVFFGFSDSLGRVMLESSHMGIPIVAPDFGPAAEILPDSNLVEAEIFCDKWFSMENLFSCGKASENEMIQKIRNFKSLKTLKLDKLYQYKKEYFFECIYGGNFTQMNLELNVRTKQFLDSIEIKHEYKDINREKCLDMIDELVRCANVYDYGNFLEKLILYAKIIEFSDSKLLSFKTLSYNLFNKNNFFTKNIMGRDFANALNFHPEILFKKGKKT